MARVVKVGMGCVDHFDNRVAIYLAKGLGDYFHGVKTAEVAALCEKNGIAFSVCEVRPRGDIHHPNPERLKATIEILKRSPKNLLYRNMIAECGGMVYWPKEYLLGQAEGNLPNLPPAKDMEEAKAFYLAKIREILALDRELGDDPIMKVDASALHKYHLEAGVDFPALETFCGDIYLLFSAIRGAAKGYNRQGWGAHLAIECYGGSHYDRLFATRLQNALYFSFLSGADPIYDEQGPLNLYDRRGGFERAKMLKFYGYDSRQVKAQCATLKGFQDFCRRHPRPENGPKVTLGIVHGHLDGNGGLWNKQVWGQFHSEEWRNGDPEFGWDYLDKMFRREKWYSGTLQGETDFTGNPPYGLYDIVPIESPSDVLGKYKCLIFLGWNTMTAEIYEKLKKFVRDGGRLLMAVPHLSVETRRGAELKLFNGGDYSDLFGVKVKGRGADLSGGHKFLKNSSIPEYRFPEWGISDPKFINGAYPLADVEIGAAEVLCVSSATYYSDNGANAKPVLTEHAYGKGKAFLLTSWCYPGRREMAPLMEEILRDICVGEQGHIRLSGSDAVRYAVYEENGVETIYLLNTDHETPSHVNLWIDAMKIPLTLKMGELKIVYRFNELCAIPSAAKTLHLESTTERADRIVANFRTYASRQSLKIISPRSRKIAKIAAPGVAAARVTRGNSATVTVAGLVAGTTFNLEIHNAKK